MRIACRLPFTQIGHAGRYRYRSRARWPTYAKPEFPDRPWIDDDLGCISLILPAARSGSGSVLLTWDFFASREDSFAIAEHGDVFSDSARSLSPLCSQRRVADHTNHLTRFGCGRKAAL
jgi:hypothetical protein